MYQDKSTKIMDVVNNYLDGIYHGDIEKLKSSFVSNAHLYGDVNGVEYSKTLYEYIEGVQNRKSPSELKEENKMKVLALEILGNAAIVKLHVPMLGYNYYDFLSLSIIDGTWKIVNKTFTNVE